MEKPSKVWNKSKSPVDENLEVEVSQVSLYNSDTVSIRSLVDAKVKVTGAVTENIYIWPHAGAVVDVDVRDKDEILNKKRGRACCGGQSGKALFEVA